MGRQVPDDADVVLKEAQIHSRGIVVVEVAEDARVDELAHFSHGAGEEERVIHHDPEILALGQLDELLRLLSRGGERLLDEHVLSVLEGGLGDLKVCPDRGHHSDGVDLCGLQQLRGVRGDRLVRIGLLQPLECGSTLVADHCDSAALQAAQVPNDVRSPIAVPEDANANHGCGGAR